MSWEFLKELLEFTMECLKASDENEDYYLGMLNAFEIIAFNTHPKEIKEWAMNRINKSLKALKEVS